MGENPGVEGPAPKGRLPVWLVPVGAVVVFLALLIGVDWGSGDPVDERAVDVPDPSIPSVSTDRPTTSTTTTPAPPISLRVDLPKGWIRVLSAPGGPRSGHVAVWTGEEMIVLGGTDGTVGADSNRTVAAFDPVSLSWSDLGLASHSYFGMSAVWTGSEVIVWGGATRFGPSGLATATGSAFDPSNGAWRLLAPSPLKARSSHSAAWTGSEMIIWGGSDARGALFDGAAYNPATDEWRILAPAPLRVSPSTGAVAWTDDRLLVWGVTITGGGVPRGMSYDPSRDSWAVMSDGPLDEYGYYAGAWTGRELAVTGGNPGSTAGIAAAYDPGTNEWHSLPGPPLGFRADHRVTAVDAGIVVTGGSRAYSIESPELFVGEEWQALSGVPIGDLTGHTAIWTGESLIVFGGRDAGHTLDDGLIWTP